MDDKHIKKNSERAYYVTESSRGIIIKSQITS